MDKTENREHAERVMKNVSEILSHGRLDAHCPAWLNMRRAWAANDAVRDEGLTYPEDVIQIKNVDYKIPPDAERLASIYGSIARGESAALGVYIYGEAGDAANPASPLYASNSLMDVYMPREDSVIGACAQGRRLPVIVSVHGGGWFYGDKELYSHYCCHLASKGFAVVNFNYRLSPQNKYPAAVEDVAYLVRFVYENAETFGFDKDSFYMVGDSAGAQLVTNYCIIAANKEYADRLDFFTYDRLPCRVCLNCGAYMMDAREGQIYDWYVKNEDGSLAMTKEQLELFLSQLSYMNSRFPETYLMYSVNDDLKTHSMDFDKRLSELGVPHVTRAYGQESADSGHVFHINLKNPEGLRCNEEECAFFRGL